MGKVEIFISTYLCLTSLQALRTCYSSAKKGISEQIGLDLQMMGIVDALMLTFLGIGHFIHAVYPIKKPVRNLWIGVMLCGFIYGLIPVIMQIQLTKNIYALALIMSISGYLQSYFWPNLMMIVNSQFKADKNSSLIGFWTSGGNCGNMLGYGIFQLLLLINSNDQKSIRIQIFGLGFGAVYTFLNGLYVLIRFKQLQIANPKEVRQKSLLIYEEPKRFNKKIGSKSQNLEDEGLSQNFISEILSRKSHISYEDEKILFDDNKSAKSLSKKSVKILKQIHQRIERGVVKQIRVVPEPDKVAQTPLSISQVFKDPNIVLLTITMSLCKSVIFGIMLWLPLYFKSKHEYASYANKIPLIYQITAILGSVGIGYLFKKINNKGFLMIPFMLILFACFFILKYVDLGGVVPFIIVISIAGFSLGGIFNTLCGLVLVELTHFIPQNLKTSSLGFYSALTMSVANFSTAITQALIGFVIGKDNQENIFLVFMIYTAGSLICLIFVAILTQKQHGQISKAHVVVIEEIKDDDNSSEGRQPYIPSLLTSTQKSQSLLKSSQKTKEIK